MAVQEFCWQVETAVLSLEAELQLPAVPTDISDEEKELCQGLVGLVNPVRCGNLQGIFDQLTSCSWTAPLASALSRKIIEEHLEKGGLAKLQVEISEACSSIVNGASSSSLKECRAVAVSLVAVGFLQHYFAANWTGPAVEDDNASWPFHPSAFAEDTQAGKAVLEALEVDGELLYELLCAPGYLWLACLMLGILSSDGKRVKSAAGGEVLPILKARCAFAWQLSIADASERGCGQCPTLFKLSLQELVGTPGDKHPILAGSGLFSEEALKSMQLAVAPLLHTWKRASDRPNPKEAAEFTATAIEEVLEPTTPYRFKDAPASVRAVILLEVANRLNWYNRTKVWDAAHDGAKAAAGFEYEITGVLGLKREYQTVEMAQLVVKTKSSQEASEAAAGANAEDTDAQAPDTLKLKEVDDMTDVLEKMKLSKTVTEDEKKQIEKPLSSIEAVMLLSKCHEIWATSNPNDEMTLQEINALATRVLMKEEAPSDAEEGEGPLFTTNWLTFSCALWYRCKAEHHRNKTRERAAFQLQSLVDQFDDKKPSSAHRVRLVNSVGYPARFHLQHEMGTRMMKMGMVSTAHEQFKKLRMWPEAVECLIVAERNVEATDMVNDLLEKSPSPRLWCCLGDLEKDPKHYEKAWEMSNNRFARAQRSLGRYWFDKKDIAKACECFKKSLDINPMYVGTWFTMGVGLMQLERWSEASLAFTRCLAIEDENGQAWANLAAVHLQQDKPEEARTCMVEATRRQRQSWKMWESFLGICIKLRDIQGAIQAIRRLIDLNQVGRVKDQVLGMLTVAVINDMGGLYNHPQTGKSFMRMLTDLFRHATSNATASRASFWNFYAELQDSAGDHKDALESRMNQSRALQARIWDETDPETFEEYLSDWVDCLENIDESLSAPAMASIARPHFQPVAWMVRDAVKRLHAKLEKTVQEPDWKPALPKLEDLASRAEDRLASKGGYA
eukprot:TRINITY_DN16050_c0_g7_i1.p1 TRINITY_DN16050_c0_g7~~TRINITY_DN16050_c0_g7_i1.p1  ORF type:complete len:958 (+),score=197.92 TRINITY_DN16050_c0_g7_i1:52-2925(+)